MPEGVKYMENYIIMCRSITYAQRASRLLERANVGAFLVKGPQGVTPEGCSYGIRVAGRNKWRALEIMHRAGIATGRVYRVERDGSVVEVER